MKLVESIYAAPGDPASWNAVSKQLANLMGADYSHVILFSKSGELLFSIVEDAVLEAADEYESDFSSIDVRVQRVLKRSRNSPLTEHDVMARDEIAKCPVHQEFLPKLDLRHFVASASPFTEDQTFLSSVLRNARSGEFDASAKELLAILHPHLERAVRLQGELEIAQARNAALEDALNKIPSGIIMLDQRAHVAFANTYAQEALSKADGICTRGGTLAAQDLVENQKLDQLVERASGRSGARTGGALLLRRQVGRPLALRILPLPNEFRRLGARLSALVMLTDPDREATVNRHLLEELGLTPSEIGLAIALMNGLTLQAYADQNELAISTPRSQLKSILSKTQANGQVALVSLLERLAEEA